MIAIDEVRDYVAGDWRRPSSTSCTDVLNPATGEVIGQAPAGAAEDVAAAVDAASSAFTEWRAVPPAERIQYLFRLKQLLEEHFEDIARTITMENGKTLAEARGELRRGIENVEVACGIPILMQGYNLEDVARGNDESIFFPPPGGGCPLTPLHFSPMISLLFLPFCLPFRQTLLPKAS